MEDAGCVHPWGEGVGIHMTVKVQGLRKVIA